MPDPVSNVADELTVTVSAAELDVLVAAVDRLRYHAASADQMAVADALATRLAGIARALNRRGLNPSTTTTAL